MVTLDSRRDFRSYDVQSKSASNSETAKDIGKRKRALSPTNAAGKPVNKLIIQNDTEDEEELRKEIENSVSTSIKTKRMSIEFDETDPSSKRVKLEKTRSTENVTEHISAANKPTESHESNEKFSSSDLHKIRTSKSSGNKYENLPSRKYK